MLILASTSDLLRLTNTPAADLDVHASWADLVDAATTATPGRTNNAYTTAQTNATIVGSPAASTKRTVNFLSVRNRDTVDSTTVTINHTDGTTAAELISVTLAPGEALVHDHGTWFVYDASGAVKASDSVAASDTQAGRIQLAIQSEMETGTDVTRAVTPGRQHFHPSAVKAWLRAGLTGNILASYNITSLTDTGVGALTVTIATDFSSANWACTATIELASTTLAQSCTYDSMAAGSVILRSVVEAGSAADPVTWGFQACGDQ